MSEHLTIHVLGVDSIFPRAKSGSAVLSSGSHVQPKEDGGSQYNEYARKIVGDNVDDHEQDLSAVYCPKNTYLFSELDTHSEGARRGTEIDGASKLSMPPKLSA